MLLVSGLVAIMNRAEGLPLTGTAEFRVTIPSTPAALSAAVRLVRTAMELMAFDQDWVFRTELCLHEALLNAHFHGNEANAGREIRVGCSLAPDKVEMDVEDEGKGYYTNPELSLPLKGDSHGRGMYLIRRFMNSVAVQDNGRRIVMSLNKE
jgi:serine/threonine-protein kinase RsbW